MGVPSFNFDKARQNLYCTKWEGGGGGEDITKDLKTTNVYISKAMDGPVMNTYIPAKDIRDISKMMNKPK